MRIFSGSSALAEPAMTATAMTAQANRIAPRSACPIAILPCAGMPAFFVADPRLTRIMRSRLILQANAQNSYRRDGNEGRVRPVLERSPVLLDRSAPAGGNPDVCRR